MKKGDLIFLQKLWYDKKVVCYISTFKNFKQKIKEENGKKFEKPEMIKDYDQNMGGVDKYDQMLKTYYNERKSFKWTNKFAVYFLNMMVHNLDFRKDIIDWILKDADDKILILQNQHKNAKIEHWPIEVASNKRRDCFLHRKVGVRKQTRVYCEGCGKFLCIYLCFKEYHNVIDCKSSSNDEVSVSEEN
jgi:hypothetical protein